MLLALLIYLAAGAADAAGIRCATFTADGPSSTPRPHPAGHHRLHTRWAFWYQKKHKRGTTSNWYEGLTLAGRFHTVEGFWALYSHMIRPDSLEGSVDVMLFRDGIQVRA